MTSHLTLGVTFAVLGAALLHASWNAIAHRIDDRLIGFVLIEGTCAVISVVVVPFVGLPAAGAWPYLLASVATHIVYVLLLLRCFQIGDFGQVYPLARGTSPWVVAVIAATVLGESLSPVRLTGVLVVSLGLGTLVFAGGRLRRRDLPAVTAAFLTGISIATYTVFDGVGVRAAHSTLGYIAWLFLLQGVLIPVGAFAMRGPVVIRQCRPLLSLGCGAGVASLVAYGVVIWAQTQAPLASVAALREVAIVFGAIIGTVWFHERFGRWRLVGSALAVVGILLLNL